MTKKTPRPTRGVSEIHFNTAAELLSFLLPSNERWPPDPRLWVFRGQQDSTWPLIASAFRKDAVLRFHDISQGQLPEKHQDQVDLELRLLLEFFSAIDDHGFVVPDDSHRLRTTEGFEELGRQRKLVLDGKLAWPPPEWRSLAALAQHYGVPTRLLDWSRNALTAAYFAARPAAEALAKGKQTPLTLGVWSFCVRFVQALAVTKRVKERPILPIEIVSPPYSSNPNLAAQRGTFTLHRALLSGTHDVQRIPFDDVVAEEAKYQTPDWYAEHQLPETILTLATLPGEQARCMLRLLSYHGVDAAHVFPGHRGVAEALKETAYWDEPPPQLPR